MSNSFFSIKPIHSVLSDATITPIIFIGNDRMIEIKLNREEIKYIAMFTMLLNHISVIFMESGTFLSELFISIGYFTAIVMCCFLVEGYQYTHSKKRYAQRLALFALISEIPYCIAFTTDGIIAFCGFNMIFTLLLCFGILYCNERISMSLLRYTVILSLVIISLFSDWALFAPLFTLLFIWSKENRNKRIIAFVVSAVSFSIFSFLGGIGRFPVSTNIIYAFTALIGFAVAGIVIICFYNGKTAERGKTFSKWLFYLFYPLHLLILGIIRILIS